MTERNLNAVVSWFEEMDKEDPKARITQSGRWTYHIEIVHGLMCETPGSFALGRGRAEKKAARMLRRYIIRTHRRANVRTIGG